ncbi:cytochrome P450 2S1-like [Physella acuta]|uniref:cytochrome P450 2S1-like n=1 Tax=Physella acuta TaxID=109671 RepID=UPI0027DCA74B|nr:cytochrome P450 2S1-like [Physella acuta]XP_059141838.1 cytochrome P450 2S1-like [Physella acuta]
MFGNGEPWDRNRKLIRKALELPSFRPVLEDVIRHEMDMAFQNLETYDCTKPIKLGEAFLVPSINIIAGALRGAPLPPVSEERRALKSVAQDMIDCDFRSLLTKFSFKCPVAAKVLSKLLFTDLVDVRNTLNTLRDEIRKWVEEIRLLSAADDGALAAVKSSIIYSLLTEFGFTEVSEEKEAELVMTLNDMFIAGVTTVQSAFEFILMYLSKYPDEQKRAQEEVERVAGSGDLTWAMQEKMPFVWACILEGLRLAVVVPTFIPHVLTQDMKVDEYTLHKGTIGAFSLCSVHRDEKYFTEPELFDPMRHLEDGKIKQIHSYRPYGFGRRSCVGWDMANIELFLMTTSVLRSFDFWSADNIPPQNMEMKSCFAQHLKNFTCFVIRRSHQ